jgi:hypothetical protein
VLAEWNKVYAGVGMFNLEFEKLGKGEEKSRESISGTVMKIHEAIRDTDARASLLAARIGKDDTVASGEGLDTIRRLCDSMAEVRELAEARAKAIPEVVERSDDLMNKMSNMSKNLIGLKTFTVESLSVIQRKLARVAGEASQSPKISGRLDNMDPEFERVKRRINGELKRHARVYVASSRDDDRANLGVDVAVLKRRLDRVEHEAGI